MCSKKKRKEKDEVYAPMGLMKSWLKLAVGAIYATLNRITSPLLPGIVSSWQREICWKT